MLIERVLCNLLENSAKYTPPGSTLHLHAAVHGDELRVAVSDNGPGVPADIRGDLFDPFVTTKREGRGLGLALVAKLARDMGGTASTEALGQAIVDALSVHPLEARRHG